jgi:hypothetical protein
LKTIFWYGFFALLFFVEADCAIQKRISTTDTLDLFKRNTLPIGPVDKTRWFDCPDNSNINNMGDPMVFRNQEFNYFSENKYPHLQSGLIEHKNFPVLLSLYGPVKPEPSEKRVIVTFRGDTSGYHKSMLSKPYLKYMSNSRKRDMMFLFDELIYRDGYRDLKTANLIYICHSRKYLKTMMGANWDAVTEGGAWDITNQFFDPYQKLELFSYSNGTLPKNEFISRKLDINYEPQYFKIKDYVKFLQEYIQSSKLIYNQSKNIYGILDIEGNYFAGKPLWDTLSFVKEVIEPDPERYFFAIVSVTEENAYQNHVRMIQALELSGEEEITGIIRYKNKSGNVVIDIITNHKPPYYEGFYFNLERMTKFKKHPAPRRIKIGHLQLIPYAMKRFQANPWHDSLVN